MVFMNKATIKYFLFIPLNQGATMIYNKEKYSVNDKYPRKEDFITFYVYNKGTVIFQGTFVNLKKFFLLDNELGTMSSKKIIQNAGHLVEENFDDDAFKQARKEYSLKEQALIAEYKKELYERESFFSDSINDRIYSRAWSERHSEGYEAVEDEFIELLDFVGDIIKIYKQES